MRQKNAIYAPQQEYFVEITRASSANRTFEVKTRHPLSRNFGVEVKEVPKTAERRRSLICSPNVDFPANGSVDAVGGLEPSLSNAAALRRFL